MRAARFALMLVLACAVASCAKARQTLMPQDQGAAADQDAAQDLVQDDQGSGRLDLTYPEAAPGTDLALDIDLAPDLTPPPDLMQPDTCSPDCAGKCKGADDGCGKPCPVSQCTGC